MSESKPNPQIRSDLSVETVEDDLLILDQNGEQIHQLNHTAHLIWKGVEAGDSMASIADKIVEEFDISKENAMRDVEATIEHFNMLNLLD